MGLARDFGTAFAKSQSAAYGDLPSGGTVFVSLANRDKRTLVFPISRLAGLGFRVLATRGTAGMLKRNGIECEVVNKHTAPPENPGEPTVVARACRGGTTSSVRKVRGCPDLINGSAF